MPVPGMHAEIQRPHSLFLSILQRNFMSSDRDHQQAAWYAKNPSFSGCHSQNGVMALQCSFSIDPGIASHVTNESVATAEVRGTGRTSNELILKEALRVADFKAAGSWARLRGTSWQAASAGRMQHLCNTNKSGSRDFQWTTERRRSQVN